MSRRVHHRLPLLMLDAVLVLSTLLAHLGQNVPTSYGYDAAGRQMLVCDALGHVTLAHYDAASRADYTPRNPSSVQLDASGDPVAPTPPPAFDPAHPDREVATLYAYDALGEQTLVTQTGILTSPGALVHGACNPLTGLPAQPLTQTVGSAITTTGGLCYDAFVTRLSADGQAVMYSTYLGGGRDDYGYGIAADGRGDAYVTGRTESPDFPVSGTVGGSLDNSQGSVVTGGSYPACHQTYCPDAFAVKLDTTSGGLVPLGLPAAQAPALWTPAGLQGGVVAGAGGLLGVVLPPTLGATAGAIVNTPSEVWGRYLGGSGADEGRGLALDPRAWAGLAGGGVYVAGQTASADFPTSSATGAYSATLAGGADAFVTRLLGATGAISYSTLLGGGGDEGANAIAVDTAGHAYVAGGTASADYPTLGALQPFLGASGPLTTSMAFVTKLNKQGTAQWYSTYLGGSGGDSGAGVGVDGIGDVWATGPTGSADFLTLRPRQPVLNNTAAGASQSGNQDAFVSVVDATTRHFVYAYDGLQRLTGVSEMLGTAYGYGYDAASNRTGVWVNGSQTRRDQYDAADELITSSTPGGGAVVDTYDAAGNLTSDAANGYGYDALDRLVALTNTTLQQTTYAYNGDGALVAEAANGATTRYTQDAAANPDPGQDGLRAAQALAAATPDAQDPAAVAAGSSADQAVPDTTGATGDSLATADAGALPDPSAAAHQAGTGTGAEASADAAGGAAAFAPTPAADTATGTPAAGPSSSAAPDGTNHAARPIPVAAPAQSSLPVAPLLPAQPAAPGPVPATVGTDAGLSRVLQTTQQTGQGTNAPVDYLYGVARLASTGALNPQAHLWYVADLQGSVRYTQDDAGGSGSSLTYDPTPPRYDPYGGLDRGADGDGVVAQPFAYRGELQDAATGLVYLRARLYNPTSGQFLTRDPLEQQTDQPYAYAGDDPQDNADPSGLDFIPEDSLSFDTDSYYDKLDNADQVPPEDLLNITYGLIQDFVGRSGGYAVGPVTIPGDGGLSTVDIIDFEPKPEGHTVRAALYQFARYSSGCGSLPHCQPSQEFYTPQDTRYLGRYDPSGDQSLDGAVSEIEAFQSQAQQNPGAFPSSVKRIINRIDRDFLCRPDTLAFNFPPTYYPFPLAASYAYVGPSVGPQPPGYKKVRSGIVSSSSPNYNGYLVNARGYHGPSYTSPYDNIVFYNVEGGHPDASAITGYKYQYILPCTSKSAALGDRTDQVAMCAGYAGTALDAAAFILLLVPGGEPVAGVLGGASFVLNSVITGYQATRFVFVQSYQNNPENRAGLALSIASLAIGKIGSSLAARAVNQAQSAVDVAIARGAPKAAIEDLEGKKEDAEQLARFANAYFGFHATVFDLVNQFQAAQPLPSPAAVLPPPSTANFYIVTLIGRNNNSSSR